MAGRAALGLATLLAVALVVSGLARAQLPGVGAGLRSHPLQRNQPVTFTADRVTYDRDANTVTATGHVEAWQDDHVVRADKVVYDRNTNVVAAYGNVVLLEPDGEVLFAKYAELSQGMRDAVMRGMRAILAANARMAANGARRVGGKINELSRVIYSPCNLCKSNPSAPTEWDVRAFSVTQDLENKRIYFEDAVLDMYGIPIAYTPYFSIPDPSVKRASGFLIPNIGNNSLLGAFASLPYFWVINKSSDATIIPTIDSDGTGQIETIYRQRFNDGTLRVDVAGAYDDGRFQGLLFGKGDFDLNDQWRYGFNVNEATSADYLRDFRLQGYGLNELSSVIYAEGFGQGAYSRADVLFFQGLVSSVDDKQLPFVLPRYSYDYFGDADALGGRWEVMDSGAFNVFRIEGTSDQRAGGIVQYELPEVGRLGDVWDIRLRLDGEAYNALDLSGPPNFGRVDAAVSGQAMPTAAAKINWPWLRPGGSWGSQLVEPIVQFVARPNNGESGYYRIPNEDSLDLMFSDMNLFALNRFPGIDREEGGSRVDVGLHTAWYAPSGANVFDALIGQSYNAHKEANLFPPLSGLNDWVSDVVARAYLQPTSWFNLTARTRLDHRNEDIRYADATAAVGPDKLKLSLGYLYSAVDPYYALDTPPGQVPTESYFQPRNELTMGLSTKYGHWKLSGFARRDLEHNEMVAVGGNAAYEDECLIAALNFFRLFTNYNGESNITGVTLTFTFKTLGKFGFSAL